MANKNITVGIADNALVISFLTAETPRVWRTDFALFHNAALEVHERQGKFALVMKRENNEEVIATFADKKDAVETLRLITDALLTGPGVSVPRKSGGWLRKIFKFALGVVVLFLILAFIGSQLEKPPGGMTPVPPAAVQGVPTPLDDVIGK